MQLSSISPPAHEIPKKPGDNDQEVELKQGSETREQPGDHHKHRD